MQWIKLLVTTVVQLQSRRVEWLVTFQICFSCVNMDIRHTYPCSLMSVVFIGKKINKKSKYSDESKRNRIDIVILDAPSE